MHRGPRPGWARLVAATMLAAACAGTSAGGADEPDYPQAQRARAATAGTELLQFAPRGAELVIELDLERMRAHPLIGPLYAQVVDQLPQRFAGLRGANAVVLCGYAVGGSEAASLLIVRGSAAPPASVRIADDVAALGPPALTARVEALVAGQGASVMHDPRFGRLRDAAMPAQAAGAVVRVTARLGFDARVGLSSMLTIEAVPAAISLWGDIADDLALVGLLTGSDPAEGAHLARDVRSWVQRAMGYVIERPWTVRYLVERVEVEHRGSLARAVFVLGPKAFQQLARRLNRQLAAR